MGIYKSKIKNFKKYDVNCFQARSLLPEYTLDEVRLLYPEEENH